MFSEENEHNPLILQDCPNCHGTGSVCVYEGNLTSQTIARGECPVCEGSGVSGKVERYFAVDDPEVAASVTAEGWVTCPKCGWRFTTQDPNSWTGRRHLKCGQKIAVLECEE